MTISEELWVAYTRIFFVELAYWIVSIGMVFVNEFVLSTNILTDDLTVFITIFQILFSLGILVTLNHITKTYLNPQTDSRFKTNPQDHTHVTTKLLDDNELELAQNGELDEQNNQLERSKSKSPIDQTESLSSLFNVYIPQTVNLETCKLVLPLSILYIGMLLLNNFCLKYVGVAFYFVSRSLTTVFNVTFTYFLINEPVSRGALICCAFIILGFILGIDQESVIGSLSVIGVMFGVASSLFTSLFTIYTKKTLAKLDKNIWVLVMYNNINAIILCTPLLIIHGDIQALISGKVIDIRFWFLLSLSGVMAFFISIVTNASIKYTSPLTHNISGTAKACLQTVMAVIYDHSHKSVLWWLSNITILLASTVYSRIRQLEMEHRAVCLPQNLTKNSMNVLDCEKQTIRRNSNSSHSDASEICFSAGNHECCLVQLQGSQKQIST